MKSFSQKLSKIILPCFLLLILFCGLYTLLNWWFVIRSGWKIKEDVANVILPLALPWIPILIFLRPRIKNLRLSTKRDLVSLYCGIAWLGIAIPTIILQMYMEKATGVLTVLENVHQLNERPVSKYYQLNKFYIVRNNLRNYNQLKVKGKHNEDLVMSIYIVMPVLADSADTTSHYNTWYGVTFSKTISNRDSDSEKDAKWKEFFDVSFKEFDTMNLNKLVYFDNIAYSDDKENYLEAVKEHEQAIPGEHFILIPVDEPFKARLGNKLNHVFLSIGIFMIVWTIMIAIPKLKTDSEVKRQRKRDQVEARDDRRFFMPRKGFLFTPLIAYGNILIFLIMIFSGLGVISFKGQDLVHWGANYAPQTMNGEWWRLVTNTFIHGGIMHILSNMFGLIFIGIFLEPVLKSKRFVLAYIFCGICGSIASVWWKPEGLSVGASGAIFGLDGMFLALILTKAYPIWGKGMLTTILIYIGYNLVMGALTPQIDNAAHIGGLLSGFILGLIFSPFIKIEQQRENIESDEEMEI